MNARGQRVRRLAWWQSAAAVSALAVLALSVFWLGRRWVNRPGEGAREYAGSESCAGCHETAYEDWKRSNHGLAERFCSAEMDKRAFPSGKYEVTAVGPGKTNDAFPVARVIGNDPLRQFLVAFPGGRYQTLEASYDPHRNEWFEVYGNEKRQPGEWGHWTGRGMNWNNMCAICHNTRLLKNYDEKTDSYATTMAEMSVGCEACHGPMKEHVRWQKDHRRIDAKDSTIRQFSPDQKMETCAQCHSRRADLTGDFSPGDSFDDHHSLAIVDETDTYYPDGQVHEEDYEYAAFLGSKMHDRGVRCFDCHQPHSGRVRLAANLLCLRCHDGSNTNAPMIDPVKHSFHQVDPLYFAREGIDLIALANRDPSLVATNGGECINCHMPQTFYMQRHRRHDHGFTTPDPMLTKQAGIPNACNRCHTEMNADWAIAWTDKWYGRKMERPSRQRALAIAAGRRGEAGAQARLLSLLSTNQAPYWQAVAIHLLGRWADEPAVDAALREASNDTNSLVRASAARGLRDEATLRVLLGDPVRNVRLAAAWTLREHLADDGELKAMLDYTADQPQGRMQKGAYALSRGDVPGALRHYEKAAEWDANSAPIRHDYAVALSQAGRGADAINQLEAACRLDPREAEYPYKLGLAWNETGNLAKTIEALKAAVRLDPTHARAWYNLGLALNSANRAEEALEALLHGESADPADPRIPYACASILARLGRDVEANEAARRAERIRPGYAPPAGR